MDRHVWELGRARVIISQGKVVEVLTDPVTTYCPLKHSLWEHEKQTRENVKLQMEDIIRRWGYCTPSRIIETNVMAVGYGASEALMTAMEEKIIDAAVAVCEGAGTIITDKPNVVEGVGLAMGYLVETSPIPEIIEKLEGRGCVVLNPETALIDQVEGVKRAFEMGYRRVGVTVGGGEAMDVEKIRRLEKGQRSKAFIIVVHTTGIPEELTPYVIMADISHGCASKVVRHSVTPKARVVFGKNIPAYAFTEVGEKVLRHLDEVRKENAPLIKIAFVHPPEPLS